VVFVGRSKLRSAEWTPKEDEILKKMWEKGFSVIEVCKVLTSRTEAALANRVTNKHLKRPDPIIDLECYARMMQVVDG